MRHNLRTKAQQNDRISYNVREAAMCGDGKKIGIACTTNAALTDLVKRVERNELSPDPLHIKEPRLN